MDARDTIFTEDTSFQILKCEWKDIVKPDIFGISPTWTNDKNFDYISIYEIKEYQLYLKSFTVTSDRGFPTINGVEPESCLAEKGIQTVQYKNIMVPVKFTGAIIIGNTLIKNYGLNDDIPCYSYKLVRELIFQDGKLVTTIDHSKDMLRIRKNLDLGLRSLNKARDVKCITHYIKSSFVGDYAHPDKIKKMKRKKINFNFYIQKIKNRYSRIKSS